jgi:hypothetical protein
MSYPSLKLRLVVVSSALALGALTFTITASPATSAKLEEKIEKKFCKAAVNAVGRYYGSKGQTSADGKKNAVAHWQSKVSGIYGAKYAHYWLAADKTWKFEEGGDIDANRWHLSAKPCAL